MQINRDLAVPGPPDRVFGFVDDLERYPPWMRLVHDVEPVGPGPADPEGSRAWSVELRSRIGPLARSKRLRMVRTEHDPPRYARFERIEVDGRTHATWELDVHLRNAESDESSAVTATPEITLTMSLTYGGRLWTGALLQRILDDEITAGSEALVGLVALKR